MQGLVWSLAYKALSKPSRVQHEVYCRSPAEVDKQSASTGDTIRHIITADMFAVAALAWPQLLQLLDCNTAEHHLTN